VYPGNTYALECTASGQDCEEVLGSGQPDLFCSLEVYFASLPTTAWYGVTIVALRDNNGANPVYLAVYNTGTTPYWALQVGGIWYYSTSVVNTGLWYYLQVERNTAGTANLWVGTSPSNAVNVLSPSGTITNNAQKVLVGELSADMDVTLYMDGVVVADTSNLSTRPQPSETLSSAIIDYGDYYSIPSGSLSTLDTYGMAIFDMNAQASVPSLRALDSSMLILAYLDLIMGVDGYRYNVSTLPESAFLHDTAGYRIKMAGSSNYLMDITSSAWQVAYINCVNNSISSSSSGLYCDDVWDYDTLTYYVSIGSLIDTNGTIITSVNQLVGQTPNYCQSQATWRSAMGTWLGYIKANITPGMLVIINSTDFVDNTYLAYVDGEMFEGWFYANWFSGYQSSSALQTQITEMSSASATGKIMFIESSCPSSLASSEVTQAVNYCYAASLLGMNGANCYFGFNYGGPYSPFGTEVVSLPLVSNLGSPSGSYYLTQNVYMRNFANGIALLNPSASNYTVTLPGNYLLNGAVVSSVTINAYSGMVLASVSTLTIESATGGTTNPVPGVYNEPLGTTVTITAVPSSGYTWVGWSINGSGTDSGSAFPNPYSVTLMSDLTIAPVFISNSNETLTIDGSANGSVFPVAGTYNYAQGTQATVTATPNSGYILDHWIVNTGSGNTNTPANGNTLTLTMNSNITVTPVFVTAPLAPGSWIFNYWNGSAWINLANAALDPQGIMEELDGTEQAILNVPNTNANRTALGLNSPTASNVPVQIMYRGTQVWFGLCTGAQMTATNLQCIAYNPTFCALKQAPGVVSYHDNFALYNIPAAAILQLILNATGAYVTVTIGTCPGFPNSDTNIIVPLFDVNRQTAINAIIQLAQMLNLDYWGSGSPGNLQINIGVRDDTTYSDANFSYETTTQRGLDRSIQVNTVFVQGTDSNGSSIQGQAGTGGGPVQVYVYSQPNTIATLNNIAAYELSILGSPSTGNPLSILTETAAYWHPGQYVTLNRSDLALVGTYEIIRITKGPVLTTVEVEAAVPRLDVNLQNLTLQLQAVGLNQA
jgi:hypothetical protein